VEAAAIQPNAEDELSNPKRECTIELLREDPDSVYLELMSQWPQLAGAPQSPAAIDVSKLRPILDTPTAYIDDAHAALREVASGLGELGEKA
jgi:hypothetical protein